MTITITHSYTPAPAKPAERVRTPPPEKACYIWEIRKGCWTWEYYRSGFLTAYSISEFKNANAAKGSFFEKIDDEFVDFIYAEAPEPYLYILMRTDMASMNPGKAVAQGSHAANQMVFNYFGSENTSARERVRLFAKSLLAAVDSADDVVSHLLIRWLTGAQGFGTCIVLDSNGKTMKETVAACKAAGFHAEVTHDPTYPLKDGEAFHLIPMDTCGYVFGSKDALVPYLKDFSLMR